MSAWKSGPTRGLRNGAMPRISDGTMRGCLLPCSDTSASPSLASDSSAGRVSEVRPDGASSGWAGEGNGRLAPAMGGVCARACLKRCFGGGAGGAFRSRSSGKLWSDAA